MQWKRKKTNMNAIMTSPGSRHIFVSTLQHSLIYTHFTAKGPNPQCCWSSTYVNFSGRWKHSKFPIKHTTAPGAHSWKPLGKLEVPYEHPVKLFASRWSPVLLKGQYQLNSGLKCMFCQTEQASFPKAPITTVDRFSQNPTSKELCH